MELKELMREAGIVGAGGAGFPSYAKLADGADTLVINGAECEPLLYTDYILLKKELYCFRSFHPICCFNYLINFFLRYLFFSMRRFPLCHTVLY